MKKLHTYKKNKTPFSCLTCYDATFAALMQQAGIDVILVGDSLAMVVKGEPNTTYARLDDMVYHTRAVARGAPDTIIMADVPFMGAVSVPSAVKSATALMQAGAHIVKVEGLDEKIVATLTRHGAPVCVHLGLMPQQVNLTGYQVQGKTNAAATQLISTAQRAQDAGAAVLLLECVPSALAEHITQVLDIPVIGIGAGVHTDGQILVMHDMLGAYPSPAKFVKNFLSHDILGAFKDYHAAVRAREFPSDAHSFL